MGLLLLCIGDCGLRWLDGDVDFSKRPCGLADGRPPRPRPTGDGDMRGGDRVSLPCQPECPGLLLCLGGDDDRGGERLRCKGELRRLGDRDGRRLAPGEGRLAGEGDIFLFCGGKGEGL